MSKNKKTFRAIYFFCIVFVLPCNEGLFCCLERSKKYFFKKILKKTLKSIYMINCSEDIAISINEIVFKKISNHMELYTYRYVCDKSFLFTFNLGVSYLHSISIDSPIYYFFSINFRKWYNQSF